MASAGNRSLTAIVDYGMGNLHSVTQAVTHVTPDHMDVVVTDQANVIANADHVVVPGQGAAAACMQAIEQHHLADPLRQSIAEKPFFGICMGLQVLMTHSDENGGVDCLNMLPGQVKKFDTQTALKVPHMGWSPIHQTLDHPVWHGIDSGSHFYFVHSYYVVPDDANTVVGETRYQRPFAAALAKNQLFAIQAHPEKSANNGLALYRNFLRWNGH